MDGLKEWVRGLVLLVLLASCMELLLPMNAMKKYVRMTMGLLVVLAVTRPILGFLGHPVAVDAGLFSQQADSRLPTMNEILAQATAFREKNRNLALTEARTAVALEAAKAAKGVPGVADARAAVDLNETAGEMQVRQVTVTITPGAAGRVKKVEPVRPVPPAGSTGGAKGAVAGPPPVAGAREPSAEEQALAGAVRREVLSRLGLPADSGTVRILVEPTESTRR